MEKKTYITPLIEVVPLTGERLLDDGFSETKDNTPTLNEGELDANSSFFEDGPSNRGLWDD